MKQISLIYFAASRPDYSQVGKIPSVIYYGTERLREDPSIHFHVCWKRNTFLRLLFQPLEQYLISRVGVGFRFDQVVRNLFAFRHRDVILAETDSVGLPLLLLKRLGLIRTRVGFISAGLVNELERQQPTRLFKWYKWLLQAADFIVCWSPLEEQLFRDLTGARGRFILLEADIDFYQPGSQVPQEDFILCVGRDVGRDFQALFDVVETTGMKARVVTSTARVKGLRIPDRVELVLEKVDYPTLLEWYRKARLVVVSLQEIHRFTGQRALLEALAMGKATVVARTQSVTSTYHLVDGQEVLFYDPGDAHDLARKIQTLWGDEARLTSLGIAGRAFVERLPKNAFYFGVRALCVESLDD